VRKELAARGLRVVVAAGTTAAAVPQDLGLRRTVTPDVAVGDASASDYSAIVFVGGWGASSYQYAFSGTYANAAYNQAEQAGSVNQLVNDFVAQDKYVTALSHGVTVLAWARVDGRSLLEGRTVAAWPGGTPGFTTAEGQAYPGGTIDVYFHVVRRGAAAGPTASIGDPLSSTDDVVVDGRIITGENWESAPLFARTLARAIAGR
jgi:putative intracellular protease/amidase